MRIDDATYMDVLRVATAMREADYEELSATSWTFDKAGLAEEISRQVMPLKPIVAFWREQPTAIGMVAEHRPGVVTLGMFATDNLPHIGLALTKWAKNNLIAPLMAGAHRIEAVSMATHKDAHKWLRCLGLKEEAKFTAYGKNGQDFIQFSWVRDAFCKTGDAGR